MNRDHTSPQPGAPRAADPVDFAFEALAAPRWSGSPDWRSFQEKLMTQRSSGWRRHSLLAALACGCFAAGAAAGIALERFAFSGTMHLNSGGSAQVTGEMWQPDPNSFEANIDTGGADISGGGTAQITLPDGSTATIEVPASNAQSVEPKPEPGKAPATTPANTKKN